MILGRYTSTVLRVNLKISKNFTKWGGGPFEGSMAPTIDLGKYESNDLNAGKILPEKSLMNVYVEEVYELEQARTSTKLSHTILYVKYKNAD